MNKEELKKEFAEFCHSSALEGNLKYPTYNQIADFWLSKLDAYKSELLNAISRMAETNYISKEEAVLSAEMAWKKLLEETLANYQSSLLERIEGMIQEELSAKPANEIEKTAEWYKICGLKQVINLIKEGKE